MFRIPPHEFILKSILLFGFVCNLPDSLSAGEQIIEGQKFTLPDGLVIEEVANPSLVKRPICADFDEEGQLYVADSSGSNDNVKIQLEERPHRIVRLEDTDKDGVFDKSIVFADKMMFPEGTLWHDGSLYVAAPPQIWKLTDTTGDGVADKREKWFDGKTLTGCANDLHGPYLGPDGWIYWCKGAFAEQTYQRLEGTDLVTRASHIFRRRPEGGLIEPVMTGGMDNPVEIVFTPGGERIFSTTFLVHPGSGLRDGLIHAIYGGVYGKNHGVLDNHPRTGELMPVLSHMGAAAPCGLLLTETDQLGKEFQHNVFTCSFNMHKVTRNTLKPSGGSFETQTEDFLVCDNIDFHPTDVLEDADGSMIVIDTGGWYKLCCPTSQLSKPDILGAVYRIRKTDSHKVGHPYGENLKWSELSPEELVNLLDDKRVFVRNRAREILGQKGSDSLAALENKLKTFTDANLRLQIVWTLTRIDDPKARQLVRETLKDPDEMVRQAALHSVSVRRDQEAEPDLVEMLKSPSHQNRRAAAEALGRVGTEASVPHLLKATSEATDRALQHSLIYACMEIGKSDPIREHLASEDPKIHSAALIAQDQLGNGNLKVSDILPLLASKNSELNQTAWWIAGHHPEAEWVSEYDSYFRDQFSREDLTEDYLTQLSSRLAQFIGNSEIQKVIAEVLSNENIKNPEVRLAVLNAMKSGGLKGIPDLWQQPLLKQLETDNPKVLQATVSAIHSLSSSNPSEEFTEKLNRIAQNPASPRDVRLQALAALPGSKRIINGDIMGFLAESLSQDHPVQVRSLAIDVISSTRLSSHYLSFVTEAMKSTGPMELRRLMEIFAKLKDPQLGHQLVMSLSVNPSLASLSPEQLEKQLAGFGKETLEESQQLVIRINQENEEKYRQIEEVLNLISKGDIRRGQKVFHSTKASCIACHGMGYLGGRIGPDLTRIGKIRTERDLLESILFPSASFVRSYEPVQIVTVDGKIYNGVIRDETSSEILLQLDAEKSVKIKHSDIDEQQESQVSIMPQGLVKEYTSQQLADLVVFLKSRQ